MTPRRAAIVVLCWNRWDLTRRCLETLKAHTDLANADVLVVDNGSTDETPERLREIPWIRVVTNAANLGYVRGNNAGIAAAPPDADVVLLNNDVEIHQDGWLDALREAAHAAPDVGIVGCRLVLPDGRLLHAGTTMLPDTFWGQQIGALETDVSQFARTRDVEGIVFACAYLKREVLARIGGLSENFRSYFEDTDYCLRAREAGFRTVVCGGVTLVHHEHGSTADQPKTFETLFQESRRKFRSLWGRKLAARYRHELSWQSILNFPTGYAVSCREILR
ncbi:MAG TPA: glycosyltransferase family 2 protein, partial [Thermoanaerobaculia bacterium]